MTRSVRQGSLNHVLDVGKVAEKFGELQKRMRAGKSLDLLESGAETESQGDWFITKDEKNGVEVEEEEFVRMDDQIPKEKNHIKENKKYAPTTHRQMDIAAEHALAARLDPEGLPIAVGQKHPAAPADDQVLAKRAA
jgi:hypothetical protein